MSTDAEIAIVELQNRLSIWEKNFAEEIPGYGDVLRTAISALVKQVPVRPRQKHGRYVCPVCESTVGHPWRGEYCCLCGQKIFWEEDAK